ncbi:MAG: hypothetical protein QOE84_16 [Actinomycetota bacterium]|jgi:hypothetical protein|nr:hypothetical protein [Actinomycetota bacterium]
MIGWLLAVWLLLDVAFVAGVVLTRGWFARRARRARGTKAGMPAYADLTRDPQRHAHEQAPAPRD